MFVFVPIIVRLLTFDISVSTFLKPLVDTSALRFSIIEREGTTSISRYLLNAVEVRNNPTIAGRDPQGRVRRHGVADGRR